MAKLQVDLVVDDKGSLVITGFGNKVDKVMWSTRASVKSFTKELALAGVGMTAVVTTGGYLLSHLVDVSDRYSLLESRLKLVTNGTGELQAAQQGLYNISKLTRTEYGTTAGLYTRLERSTKTLNYSQQDLLTVTGSISKALVVSGASAQESNAALQQLGQGLASGVLRGQEFNSVMEQTPRVAEMLADGLGVSIGKLREMAEAGELTTETVINALMSQADTVDAEFSQMTTTVAQAKTVLKTVYESIINDGAKSASITEGLSGAVLEFADYLDENRDSIVGFFHEGLESGKEFSKWLIGFGKDAKPYLQGIAEGVAGIVGTAKQLEDYGGPNSAEMGIIGYALFRGGQPGKIIAALVTINSLLDKIGDINIGGFELPDYSLDGLLERHKEFMSGWDTIWEELSGKRDWNTGELIDQTAVKISKVKEEIRLTREELARYEGLSGFSEWLNNLAGGEEDVEFLREKLIGLNETLGTLEDKDFDSQGGYLLPYGSEEEINALEGANTALKETSKTTEEVSKKTDNLSQSIKDIPLDLFDDEIEAFNKKLKESEEAADKLSDILLDLMPDGLDKDIAKTTQEYDDLKIEIYDLGTKAGWSAEKIQEVQEQADEVKADKIKELKTELEEVKETAEEAVSALSQLGSDLSDDIGDAWSDIFSDALKGESKDLEEYWESLGESFADSIGDALGEKMQDFTIDALFSGDDSLFGSTLKNLGLGDLFGDDAGPSGSSGDPVYTVVTNADEMGGDGLDSDSSASDSDLSSLSDLFDDDSSSSISSLLGLSALSGLKLGGSDLDSDDWKDSASKDFWDNSDDDESTLSKSLTDAMDEHTDSLGMNTKTLKETKDSLDLSTKEQKKGTEATKDNFSLLQSGKGLMSLSSGYDDWQNGDQLSGGAQMLGGANDLWEGLGLGDTGGWGDLIGGIGDVATLSSSLEDISSGDGDLTDYIQAATSAKSLYDLYDKVSESDTLDSISDYFSSDDTTDAEDSSGLWDTVSDWFSDDDGATDTASGAATTYITTEGLSSLSSVSAAGEGMAGAVAEGGASIELGGSGAASTSAGAGAGASSLGTTSFWAFAAYVGANMISGISKESFGLGPVESEALQKTFNISDPYTNGDQGSNWSEGSSGVDNNDSLFDLEGNYDAALEKIHETLEAQAELGDSYAQSVLAIDGSTGSMDTFIQSLTGYNMTTEESAYVTTLAKEAAEGDAGSTKLLIEALISLGMSTDDANTAAEGMVSQMNSLGDSMSSISGDATSASKALSDVSGAFSSAASSISSAASKLNGGSSSSLGSGSGGNTIRFGASGMFVGLANGGITGLSGGGILDGGSGIWDDLYIGTVNGRDYVAMGGEAVIDRHNTKKHQGLIQSIMNDRVDYGRFSSLNFDDVRGPQADQSSGGMYDDRMINRLERLESALRSLRLEANVNIDGEPLRTMAREEADDVAYTRQKHGVEERLYS